MSQSGPNGGSDSLVYPDPLERASGYMLGSEAPAGLQWDALFPGAPSPRLALEAAVTPALRRPPCLVSFSGGRDSSLVLAVATHVARRDGLPLPIPMTRRFAGDGASEETSWQETVVRHLGLPDWEVVEAGESFDVLGPLAGPLLREVGATFPAALFVLAHAFDMAKGGSHLTGEGGDEVLGTRRAKYARVAVGSTRTLLRRMGTNPAFWREVITELGPESLRRALLTPEVVSRHPGLVWLRPAAREAVGRSVALSAAADPLDWRKSIRWLISQRMQRVYLHNAKVIANKYDTLAVDPLMDWGFMQAMARAGGRFGFTSRSAAMEFIAADLLPQEILHRESKATFNTAYFTSTSRRFVEGWNGEGVDGNVVDTDVLRAQWAKPVPPANSFILLQTAWLAAQGAQSSSGSEPFTTRGSG